MRFLPTFKYRLRDCMWSMLVIVIVMIALTLLTQFGVTTFGAYTTTEDGYTETTSTMNFTMPYVIFMLVLGIVTVREDMRIGIQNGASRRTSFLANMSWHGRDVAVPEPDDDYFLHGLEHIGHRSGSHRLLLNDVPG